VAAIGNAAHQGILIKGGVYLELMGKLKTLFLDKTGTLTKGKPEVVGIQCFDSADEKEVLYWAAVAEKRSEHPLGKAVVQKAEERGFTIPHPDSFQDSRGKGVRATFDSKTVLVGRADMLTEAGIEIPERVKGLLKEEESRGMTSLVVSLEGRVVGSISISDTLREKARATIDRIREEGVSEIWMLTGDNEQVAKRIAGELGVRYEAKLYPEEKVRMVKEWKKSGKVVAMVGDGVNDAPALAAADVGIAMGAVGTDVAIETADIALMTDELEKIPRVIRLSRKALHVIKENLVFALVFNSFLVFLSTQGWMTMILGAILHQASSLLVILNSIRLLKREA
jgi:Cd2+/Zn2+-exporting ATPase